VRQAARRSLIILSFFALQNQKPNNASTDDNAVGTAVIVDFGPKPSAEKSEREQAAKEWKSWWDRHAAGKADQRSALKSALTDAEIDAEAARLSAALVFATPEKQTAKLAQYRETPGVVYTEALADALPQLNGEITGAARNALAERLSRMTAATLSGRLGDPRAEMRRAAALAWAMKEDRSAIPALIPLLADKDELVVRAAKAGLKSLSGKDFGPNRGATDSERSAAIAAWKSWWQQQH
jgi:HEAT repeat protein